jgi:hypothetical protein
MEGTSPLFLSLAPMLLIITEFQRADHGGEWIRIETASIYR